MLKRSVDIVIAGTMLILSLPVLLVCAVLIRLESGGPALFRQTRMGRSFRTFQLLKLRTMCHQDSGTPITLGSDPRITRIGAWLRRWKVDEFPQLWNVLRGDMSLVGPRPVIPEIALEFAPDYQHLLRVRPGLTDPASIRYCREAEMLSRFPEPLAHFKSVVIPEKIHLSRDYLAAATTRSDLALIFRTAAAVLAPVRQAVLSPPFETLHPQALPTALSQD